ncbi:hypothetical protein DAPPUDRAFT_268400 [Daphnia pulex]|uniref:Uncharacterized protein n=1 Tax=Daphnia pulex TaxID=6669 RepID=E9HXS6_DAPPU|nr:hypothetical protein DAPPUDRAFT_268400 [Daphnia pulex]|eukprot:EFX63455.1 hypothetical protein DAPPUDRAFT_268400 [Daphnia pulex]
MGLAKQNDDSVLETVISSSQTEEEEIIFRPSSLLQPAASSQQQLPDAIRATNRDGFQSEEDSIRTTPQPTAPNRFNNSWLVVRVDDSTCYATTDSFANNGTIVFKRFQSVCNQSDWTDLSNIENYFPRVWSDRRNKARSSQSPPPSQLPPFCRPFNVYELHPHLFYYVSYNTSTPTKSYFLKPVQSINDLSIVSIEPAPMSPTYSTSPSTTVLPEKVIQSLAHHYDPAINNGPLSSHTLISPSRNPSRNPSLLVQLLVIFPIRYVSVPRPRFVRGQIFFGFFHSDVHSQTGS